MYLNNTYTLLHTC